MATGTAKRAAKGFARSKIGKKAAGKAGRKAAQTSTGQQLITRTKEIFEGPNRGKAIAATAAVGAAAVYAMGPGRILRYAPIAIAGLKSVTGRS